ncbi:MAG: S1/P1 nuclease, partial [Flavobacteriaceae bacterium]|nr:S1/P1 nuclease [Flavobacteriaceae bacterium]
MKYCLLGLVFCVSYLSYAGPDWGKTGHRTVGQIAEQYLKKSTARKINQLLNGMSLAEASTYSDEIKSDPRFRKYNPWHYINIGFDESIEAIERNKDGDILFAIEKCIAELKNTTTSTEDRVFYLKMLIHLIGDLHQPMHIGLKEDKGGNDFQVRWFNQGTNLHAVWDTKMIEHYKMSYTELAASLPKPYKRKRKSIESGDLYDWVAEIRPITQQVYQSAEQG